jgi:hypothetical protein
MSEFSAVPSGFPGGVEVYEPGEFPGAESVEIHHEDGRHGVHIRVQAQQDLGTSSHRNIITVTAPTLVHSREKFFPLSLNRIYNAT